MLSKLKIYYLTSIKISRLKILKMKFAPVSEITQEKSANSNNWWTAIQLTLSSSKISLEWSRTGVFRLIQVISAKNASKHCSVNNFIFFHVCMDSIGHVFRLLLVLTHHQMPWKLDKLKLFHRILELFKTA
jgi:hypothetical protein